MTTKFTIQLSEAEVKGLKKYLQEVGEMKGTKEQIVTHLENIISGNINSPHEAASDYIRQFSK